ncbi:hypothetical protein [Propylenella binzhouense]|uniref:Uncharacterized protein n=1 Tax=Propylenella binzhouense TaxID=2555902 RepID=A0A964T4B1_9HYPH|nr:hypothetical protein [Propylenella binzhouense]MYZ47277.1 hypothetical protein [Propylenella binzhouense]
MSAMQQLPGAAAHADLAHRLAGKRVFVSGGVRPGSIVLLAECGRVMAVERIAEVPDELLRLTDTVCLNHDDAADVPHRREV